MKGGVGNETDFSHRVHLAFTMFCSFLSSYSQYVHLPQAGQ